MTRKRKKIESTHVLQLKWMNKMQPLQRMLLSHDKEQCSSDTRYSLDGPQWHCAKLKMRQNTISCMIKFISNIHARQSFNDREQVYGCNWQQEGQGVLTCGFWGVRQRMSKNTLNLVQWRLRNCEHIKTISKKVPFKCSINHFSKAAI